MKIKEVLEEQADNAIVNVAQNLLAALTKGVELNDRRQMRRINQAAPQFKFTFKRFPSVIGLLDDINLPIDMHSPSLDRLQRSGNVRRAIAHFNSLVGQVATKENIEQLKQVIASIAPDLAMYQREVER